ncbi:metallophosphoesterase [Anaerovoracaceae bacterium SGI.195]
MNVKSHSSAEEVSVSEFGRLSRKIDSIWPGNRVPVTSIFEVPLGDSGRVNGIQDFLGIRIIHLSDLQGAIFGTDNRDILERVAECDPHLIVVTGDLVDRRMVRIAEFEPSIQLMCSLQNIAPVFFTYGNHERAFPPQVVDELRRKMENYGITVLDGEVTTVKLLNGNGDNIKIFIAGLEEDILMVEGKNRTKKNSDVDMTALNKSLETMMSEAEDIAFHVKILLAHEPQFIHEYAQFGFDLIFSGHAHGGQIRIPGIGGLFSPGQGFFPKLTSGVHSAGKGIMIISRGLGNSSFPFRIFNRPEIVSVKI